MKGGCLAETAAACCARKTTDKDKKMRLE